MRGCLGRLPARLPRRTPLAFCLLVYFGMKPRWRVVLVDDHVPSRVAVADALGGAGGVIVGTGASAQEANADLKKAIESRKMVERAKGFLMERHGLSEAEAFRRIQKTAMDSRRPMIEVARALLLVERLEGAPSGRRQSSSR